jgi:hypothetical protein
LYLTLLLSIKYYKTFFYIIAAAASTGTDLTLAKIQKMQKEIKIFLDL